MIMKVLAHQSSVSPTVLEWAEGRVLKADVQCLAAVKLPSDLNCVYRKVVAATGCIASCQSDVAVHYAVQFKPLGSL